MAIVAWRPRLPLLVLINPVAGDGDAVKLVDQAAAAVFDPAGVELIRVVTTYPGMACQYVKELGCVQY